MASAAVSPQLPISPSLDPEVCERARVSRDRRFDGRFFVGVRTTGVYCRPICPVRLPKAANVRFFPTAASAAEAGFRPCLRCRPEASPGTPAWLGTSATVSRALRLIEAGALDEAGVEELAARLGIGPRHLRRLFLRHLGATPVAVAQHRRLLFAKRLLDETALSMTQVSQCAGFQSVRRFNAIVRRCYGRSPKELRALARRSARAVRDEGTAFALRLPYRPPYDWHGLASFLALRATPGVEHVGEDGYARSVCVDGRAGWLRVRPLASENALELSLRLSGPVTLATVVERVRRIFDLGADPVEIARHLGRDALLAKRVRANPGLRVPGAWDGFELAVRAVLGQQVSVKGATTLAGRLAGRFGEPMPAPEPGEVTHLFPAPEVLAEADLASVGLPRARAEAIRALAVAVASGALRLDAAPGLEDFVEQMRRLPGVGAWTAHYVAMRACGEPDAFPESDLGLLRAAEASAGRPFTPRSLRAAAEAWRPWRAYAAMHLWQGPSPKPRGERRKRRVLQPSRDTSRTSARRR